MPLDIRALVDERAADVAAAEMPLLGKRRLVVALAQEFGVAAADGRLAEQVHRPSEHVLPDALLRPQHEAVAAIGKPALDLPEAFQAGQEAAQRGEAGIRLEADEHPLGVGEGLARAFLGDHAAGELDRVLGLEEGAGLLGRDGAACAVDQDVVGRERGLAHDPARQPGGALRQVAPPERGTPDGAQRDPVLAVDETQPTALLPPDEHLDHGAGLSACNDRLHRR